MPRFSIRLARQIFKDHFEKDDNFREVYVANIAMLLHDRYGITDFEERNKAANDIMAVIFDAKDIKKTILNSEDSIKDRWEILDI